MSKKTYYTPSEFEADVILLAKMIGADHGIINYSGVHGVPAGGTALACSLSVMLGLPVIDEQTFMSMPVMSQERILVVDDVVDSGETCRRYVYSDFACLHTKKHAKTPVAYCVHDDVEDWIVYWWEGTEEKSIEDSVIRQLEYIGEDPTREGLVDTPARVVKSWDRLFGGYNQNVLENIVVFEQKCDEIVLLKDIEFYSTCEHHILPFFGKAHIAYIPDGKVLGISKLARILEVFARRLQIQERICEQVVDTIQGAVHPIGCACILEAQHFCMTSRGVEKQNSKMTTSALRGVFKEKPETRAELLRLIG